MARVLVESEDRNPTVVLDHKGGTAWCPICQATIMGDLAGVLDEATAHVEWHESREETV